MARRGAAAQLQVTRERAYVPPESSTYAHMWHHARRKHVWSCLGDTQKPSKFPSRSAVNERAGRAAGCTSQGGCFFFQSESLGVCIYLQPRAHKSRQTRTHVHAHTSRHASTDTHMCAYLGSTPQVAQEMLADVPASAQVWGWKEPQAIFTLPFLVQARLWYCPSRCLSTLLTA